MGCKESLFLMQNLRSSARAGIVNLKICLNKRM